MPSSSGSCAHLPDKLGRRPRGWRFATIAMRTEDSFTVGIASQKRRSSPTRSRNCAAVNCGDPMGVPRTFKPSGCHASSPSSSMSSGAVPLLFQTFVLPSWSLMPATLSKDSRNTLNSGTTRWQAKHVHIVQECAQLFPVLQV